ncbi:MAG: DUF892 family protein [Pseudomonadota bacterium]
MPASPSTQPSAQPVRPLAVDRGCGEPISLGANLLAGRKVRPDVLGLLADDHRTVLGWFDWYQHEAAAPRRSWIAANIVKALQAHMAIEEEIFYPAAEEATGEQALVEHAFAEHAEARDVMEKLRAPGADTDSLMATLRRAIEKHVEEEETDLFPRVRATDLDRYEIGALCAARRVELLFEMVPSDKPALKEMPPMPISQEEARSLFVVGLRNIHGTARQCRTMVQAQESRVESYPNVKAKLQAHLREKDAQLQRIESILDSLGESTSTMKDVTGTVMGAGSSMMAAAADDEIIKASFTTYGLANFEAASYEMLLTMGEAAGVTEALPPLQQSLSEERAMAAFLAENLRATGLQFMQLRTEGRQAAH